jgi:hypothetical protein
MLRIQIPATKIVDKKLQKKKWSVSKYEVPEIRTRKTILIILIKRKRENAKANNLTLVKTLILGVDKIRIESR